MKSSLSLISPSHNYLESPSQNLLDPLLTKDSHTKSINTARYENMSSILQKIEE